MATRYAVETVFKLIDQFTNPLGKADKRGRAVANALKDDFAKAQKTISGIGPALVNMGKAAAAAGVALAAGGVAVATKQYIEFNEAITKSGSLFKDLDPLAADYATRMKAIEKEARTVAAATEYSATETADALAVMATAGVESATALGMLAPTADLATAAGIPLATAFDKVAGVIGGMGLEMGAEEVTHISDVMAKTAQSFNTDFVGISEAAQYAAPSFAALHQPVETLAASIGILANAGIKGSSAGTALKAVMTQLSSTAKQKALRNYGIQATDAAGNLLPLADIVGQLQEKLGGLGDVERSGILNQIFDTRGASAMNVLLSAGAKELGGYTDMLFAAGGASSAMAANMRTSLGNQIKVLGSALTELGFKFVEAFQKDGSDLIQSLTNAVNNFDVTPIVNGAKMVVSAIGEVVNIVRTLSPLIIGITTAFVLYKGAMLAAVVVTNVMNAVQAVQAGITAGLSVQQAVLNAVMSANPVGAIVIAVGLLIGGLIALYQHCEPFREFVKWLAGGAVQAVKALAGAFLSLGKMLLSTVLTPIRLILAAVSKIPGVGDKVAPALSLIESLSGSGGDGGENVMALDAPVTNRDATVVERSESVSNSNVTIGLEKGLTAQVSGAAPDVNIIGAHTGAF